LICWRGELVPVPGAAGVRVNAIDPRSLRNSSIGSAASNGRGALSPPASWRSPKVWSRNWPQANPHWVTPFSENRFWDVSLKMRFET
jgi:hypothetical protein